MALAKTATRKGVDFDLLDDIEPGDVFQIHFTEDSIGDVAYLVGMINGGILTSPDVIALCAIMQSHDWGGGRNRYVEIVPTERFDRTWFARGAWLGASTSWRSSPGSVPWWTYPCSTSSAPASATASSPTDSTV